VEGASGRGRRKRVQKADAITAAAAGKSGEAGQRTVEASQLRAEGTVALAAAAFAEFVAFAAAKRTAAGDQQEEKTEEIGNRIHFPGLFYFRFSHKKYVVAEWQLDPSVFFITPFFSLFCWNNF
jgi:hypothetical protein